MIRRRVRGRRAGGSGRERERERVNIGCEPHVTIFHLFYRQTQKRTYNGKICERERKKVSCMHKSNFSTYKHK